MAYSLLSHITVSLIDLSIAAFLFSFKIFKPEELHNDNLNNIAVNSISIIFIVVMIIAKNIINPDFSLRFQVLKNRYIFMVIFIESALGIYVTPILYYGFTDKIRSIISMVYCCGVMLITIFLNIFADNYYQKENFRYDSERNEKLVKSQKLYYENLLSRNTERRKFYHDIMFHLKCMYSLLRNDKYKDLESYFESVLQRYDDTLLEFDTGNHIANAVLQDCKNRYPFINLEVEGRLPNNLRISDFDICTVFFNLSENAFFAADNAEQIKQVRITLGYINTGIYIKFANTCDTYNKSVPNGIGSINIYECVTKHHGTIKYIFDTNCFISEVTLPFALYSDRSPE